ncbi:MAG: TetR/AcrR family transcriptional regulator C-terminal domain-containing protein [Clostridia bacterium]|nr:TetR/AcrR family transcriptional regulator C-terminal domain-containing protein [Clostridia bacterium]
MHDTKHAFGSAMHTLMAKVPFARITVGDICETCGMSRKSFYYHFRDKYELLGWVFETEFIHPAKETPFPTVWDFVHALCHYLHTHRAFYVNAFTVCGQNAFAEQFYQLLRPVAAPYVVPGFTEHADESSFNENYLFDAFFCSLLRWLHGKPALSPDEYVEAIKAVTCHTAAFFQQLS